MPLPDSLFGSVAAHHDLAWPDSPEGKLGAPRRAQAGPTRGSWIANGPKRYEGRFRPYPEKRGPERPLTASARVGEGLGHPRIRDLP